MAQAKKGVVDAIIKGVAKKASKSMDKSYAKQAAKQSKRAANAPVKAAKKAASKEIKNAGKAGSPYTEKITIGPKTRDKMAKGKFGSKAKQGPAATRTDAPTGTVKVRKRSPHGNYDRLNRRQAEMVDDATTAAKARRNSTRTSR